MLDPNFEIQPQTTIENPEEFRAALERLRRMEYEDPNSPRERERAALEIEICRYLANREHRIR